MIAPTAVRFNTDHFIMGNTYRCTMALREYPTSTEELALLRHLGVKTGVSVRLYARQVSPTEENQIIHNATNRSRMERSNTNDLKQSVTAEANLQDVATLIATMHRNREPLLHCAIFIELSARDLDGLRALRDEVTTELVRAKLGADRIFLRQREGFLSSNPAGHNSFGSLFERVLPASSVGNLYPFNYSGKTDPNGFYIGRDRYGSNIIVDLDRRAEDKTNGNVLVLGNSGQGKSYLLKLLICNLRESGKSVLCLDPEHELVDLCNHLGGCFVDLMSGLYHINPLEPQIWSSDTEDDISDEVVTETNANLSKHISFLRDLFRSYKDFSDRHIDVIEIMLERLYDKWGMKDGMDFSVMSPTEFPIFSDLYSVILGVYENYEQEENPLYSKDLLQEVLLGLYSMCLGAESKIINGHTNITSSDFLVFGVKDLLNGSKNVTDMLLFNLLVYFRNKLLTEGNSVAVLDELHIWLSNPTAIDYIRGTLKRARKKQSSLILASQNLEDFMLPGVAEMTKPLFSIPTHHFLFNAGTIDKRFFMDNLQLEESEYELIRFAVKGECLYRCGNERYHLKVIAPPHKAKLFGTAGGT